MRQIIIKSQGEFDKITEVQIDEEVIFKADKIRINCVLGVYGILRLEGEIDSSWAGRYVVSKGTSQVHNESKGMSQVHNVLKGTSQVHNVLKGSSQVHNVSREMSQVHNESWGSSQVHNVSWGMSQVHNVSREMSQVHNESWGSSQVHNESWGMSQVHNESWETSQVHNVLKGTSQVHNESWETSQVHNESWGMSVITTIGNCASLVMHGFSVAILPVALKLAIKKAKTCVVQRCKPQIYLEREGVPAKKGKVILFKKVSVDWKTQEKTKHETIWTLGSTLTHPAWEPDKEECRAGKYHACSRPYFCDEFRNKNGDRYIAIEITTKDLYEWPNPQYPHKIAFRQGKVLYECNRYGDKISAKGGI